MDTLSSYRTDHWTRSAVLLLTLVAAGPARSLDAPGRVFEGAPPDSRLGKAVTLDGYHHWEPPRSLEDWRHRSEEIRRRVLVAAGLWPMPPRTPLRPVIHGRIERSGYTVEKVFFESLPGFFVTGNLYRPLGPQVRRAGVLCPHGHWSNGRLYERSVEDARKEIAGGGERHESGARYPLQARCAHLARMGCVVFHYDMVGYADSRQLGHASGFGDVEAELRLQSAFGLQTWNSIRALDFLESLPDVDPARIGVTGASGGGTQTFFLCAIDQRPVAAVPAVMVSTDMQGGCVCENASHLRVGATNIAFAALAAPRPLGLTGADDWTREIMTKGLPELEAVWKLHGRQDDVAAWCHTEFGHNYNQVSREYMYAWFNRHLDLGIDEPVRERPFEPIPPAELRVFDDDHPVPEHAVDPKQLRAYLTEVSDAQIAALAPTSAESLQEFRRVIGGALETILDTSLPATGAVESRDLGEESFTGQPYRKLALARAGSGEAVPALLFRPREWNGTVVVVVRHWGKGSACFKPSFPPYDGLDDRMVALLDGGAAVLAPDVFLTGEYFGDDIQKLSNDVNRHGADLAAFPKDGGRHQRFVGYTYGYNRTLIAQRVHDVLTAIAYARSLEGARRVNLLGTRQAANWVLLARALAGDAVTRTVVVLREPLDFATIESPDHPSFLPGALKYGGMPSFTALCAPGELIWVSPAHPGDLVTAAYRAAGAQDRFEHLSSVDPAGASALIGRLAE